jgi:ribose 5-phosphate isomerase B
LEVQVFIREEIMTIVVGADHAGFGHKEAIKAMLEAEGHTVIDVGTTSTDRVDYPDFGTAAAQVVARGEAEMGVIVCGSGIGISIAANKVKGSRAANVTSVDMARLARAHNNANMVAIGERLTSVEDALEIVKTFIIAEFEGGRHTQRVDKLDALGSEEGGLP